MDESREWDGAVFRAVFSPQRCLAVADSVLTTTGTAVIGLRGSDVFDYRPQTPTGRITDLVDVPATILDGSVALLIMSVCEK